MPPIPPNRSEPMNRRNEPFSDRNEPCSLPFNPGKRGMNEAETTLWRADSIGAVGATLPIPLGHWGKSSCQTSITMKYFSLLFVSLLLIVGSGCEEVPNLRCVQGDGARVVEVRELDVFTQITLDMAVDVYLHQDTSHRIEITAQDNLMGTILTTQSGDQLTISNERCIRQAKTIRMDVYLSDLTGLEVNGSGDVYSEDNFSGSDLSLAVQGSGGIELTVQVERLFLDLGGSSNVVLNLDADEVHTELRGSGDLHLHGSTASHEAQIRGSGDLKAFNLLSQTTDLTVQGAGNAEVQASDALSIKVQGSGNVYYKGQPSLNIAIDGSGKVLDAN